jgi:hypothetical protein
VHVFEHLVSGIGTVSTDAWEAVLKKGKERNFGTSKQDIDEYAAVYGSITAASACAAIPALAAFAPLCAEGGAVLAAYAADVIQSLGSALFGGDDFKPQPNDVWNPVADAAIKSVVKALRVRNGDEVTSPPGGSFRNYPEWRTVALAWAQNANAFVTDQGGPIKWFYDSPDDKDPGRIRQAAIDQWFKCGGYWKAADPGTWSVFPTGGTYVYPPAYQCKLPNGDSASKPLPEAIASATQKTMVQVLGDIGLNTNIRVREGTSSSDASSSTTGTVVKLGAVAGAGALVWYFRQPIWAFASSIFKR